MTRELPDAEFSGEDPHVMVPSNAGEQRERWKHSPASLRGVRNSTAWTLGDGDGG